MSYSILRNALTFYATERNWYIQIGTDGAHPSLALHDRGRRAREALAATTPAAHRAALATETNQ